MLRLCRAKKVKRAAAAPMGADYQQAEPAAIPEAVQVEDGSIGDADGWGPEAAGAAVAGLAHQQHALEGAGGAGDVEADEGQPEELGAGSDDDEEFAGTPTTPLAEDEEAAAALQVCLPLMLRLASRMHALLFIAHACQSPGTGGRLMACPTAHGCRHKCSS